jgi:hypothetical protein
MERCPLCHAMLHGADTCRRCRAELASAQRAARESRRLVGAAISQLMQDDAAAAARLLQRALALHATPEARSLWHLAQVSSQRAAQF